MSQDLEQLGVSRDDLPDDHDLPWPEVEILNQPVRVQESFTWPPEPPC